MVTATAIKKGYKQTELGVIPEDWNVKELREVVDFTNGKAHENFILDDGHYVVVNSKYISTGGRVAKYSNECFCPVSVGSVLMVMSDVPNGRAIAKCFLVDRDNRYTVNQRICALKPRIDARFLFYTINRNPYYLAFDDGVKQTNLRKDDVLGCKLCVPKEDLEQTAIATVLSDTDALIEHLEKLIVKKKSIKQGAMQQLLTGKKRLPGFSGKWSAKELGKICDYQNGTSLEKYFNKQDGFNVISIGNYSVGGKYVDNKTYIDKKYLSDIRKFILKKNDLTMILNDKTSTGEIIGRVLLIEEDDKYVFNQRTMRLTLKESIDSLFLGILINSDIVHVKIIGLAKPGTQIYVNTNDITNLVIYYPESKLEQIAIATVLSDMDAEIESLEQKRDKYIMLKQGMMQQLLTGKIRIYANN